MNLEQEIYLEELDLYLDFISIELLSKDKFSIEFIVTQENTPDEEPLSFEEQFIFQFRTKNNRVEIELIEIANYPFLIGLAGYIGGLINEDFRFYLKNERGFI